MSLLEPTRQLLRRVARRQQLALLGARFRRAAWVLAGVYGLALLAARVLGGLPDRFTLPGVALVPAGALVLAAVLWPWRAPGRLGAARAVDAHAGPGDRDLFTTAVRLDAGGAPAATGGDFRALVLARAGSAAGSVAPARVVPWRWQTGARDLGLALTALGLATAFLPRLDPFGKRQARQRAAERREQLEQSRRAVALRAAELGRPDVQHAQVERALAEWESTLRAAVPAARELTAQRLAEETKTLGALWRQLSETQRKAALDAADANQSFGPSDPNAAKRREELRQGDTGGLQKELSELKEQARRLATLPDSPDKQRLRDQVRQNLQTLADVAAKDARSPALDAALARALENLDLSGRADLAKQALAAAEDALNLSEKELAALAQSLKDLKSLEDALRATQLAKRLNDDGKLDGGQGGKAHSPGDYAELYAQKLAAMSQGQGTKPGPGMQGPGIGDGGRAPEDGGLATAHRPEQSASALSGGKLLLQWKTSELADAGEVREGSRRAVELVRQGVSEAVLQEQIPPGYQAGIQKYFDTLKAQADAPQPTGR